MKIISIYNNGKSFTANSAEIIDTEVNKYGQLINFSYAHNITVALSTVHESIDTSVDGLTLVTSQPELLQEIEQVVSIDAAKTGLSGVLLIPSEYETDIDAKQFIFIPAIGNTFTAKDIIAALELV